MVGRFSLVRKEETSLIPDLPNRRGLDANSQINLEMQERSFRPTWITGNRESVAASMRGKYAHEMANEARKTSESFIFCEVTLGRRRYKMVVCPLGYSLFHLRLSSCGMRAQWRHHSVPWTMFGGKVTRQVVQCISRLSRHDHRHFATTRTKPRRHRLVPFQHVSRKHWCPCIILEKCERTKGQFSLDTTVRATEGRFDLASPVVAFFEEHTPWQPRVLSSTG